MCAANKYSFPFNLKSSTKEKKSNQKKYTQCAVSKIIMATYYQVNKQEFEGIIKRIRVVWQPLNIIIVRKINPATD